MTERKRKKRQTADYAVGYGKPPAEHQFRKGQPRPPRKSRSEQPVQSFESCLAAELEETMRIVENGVEQNVTKGRALAKASIKEAIKHGDPRRLKGFLPAPKGPEDFDFSEIDLAIVARFMAQFLNWDAKPAGDSGEASDDDDGEATE